MNIKIGNNFALLGIWSNTCKCWFKAHFCGL